MLVRCGRERRKCRNRKKQQSRPRLWLLSEGIAGGSRVVFSLGRDRLYFRDGSEEKRDKVGADGKSSKLSFPGFVGNLLIELRSFAVTFCSVWFNGKGFW